MALAAYRNVLRSCRIAFQGDTRVLSASLATARHNFNAKRALTPGSEEAIAEIVRAEEIAQMLRKNVVQGEKLGVNEEEKYQLRIHPEIERGDNTTAKLGEGKAAEVTGTCGQI